MVLLSVAVLQQRRAFGVDWFEAGQTQAGLIRQGQWWRTVTALTLHADVAHLFANHVLGGLFGLFAGRSLGSGLSWLCILAAGALGNMLNAGFRPDEHTSVGASTAIFGALGLLAANAWRQRRGRQPSGMKSWAPIVGGILLLSFFGTGGGRTDVPAHVFGFICGALLGATCGKLRVCSTSASLAQLLFGLGTLVILVGAWALALT